MKTTSWQPPASQQNVENDKLGLLQRFMVYGRGHKAMELSSMAALYMVIIYMRSGTEVSVTTLEGEEVLHNREGRIDGHDDFVLSLYQLSQAVTAERANAVEQALASMQQHPAEHSTPETVYEPLSEEAHPEVPATEAVAETNEAAPSDRPAQTVPGLRPRNRNRKQA